MPSHFTELPADGRDPAGASGLRMYRISELAPRVGLSCAPLLHDERRGLPKGRQAKGDPIHSEADRQRLGPIRQLRAGGPSLQECLAWIDGTLNRDLLARLGRKAAAQGLARCIAARSPDMADPPAPERRHDVIWAEGSACIIARERALREWPGLLRPGGVLVLSDMARRTDAPEEAIRAFWAGEYPAMASPGTRLDRAMRAGYQVLGPFDMGGVAPGA